MAQLCQHRTRASVSLGFFLSRPQREYKERPLNKNHAHLEKTISLSWIPRIWFGGFHIAMLHVPIQESTECKAVHSLDPSLLGAWIKAFFPLLMAFGIMKGGQLPDICPFPGCFEFLFPTCFGGVSFNTKQNSPFFAHGIQWGWKWNSSPGTPSNWLQIGNWAHESTFGILQRAIQPIGVGF